MEIKEYKLNFFNQCSPMEGEFGCSLIGCSTEEKWYGDDVDFQTTFKYPVRGRLLTGDYDEVIEQANSVKDVTTAKYAILFFTKTDDENAFMRRLKEVMPELIVVGGTAANYIEGNKTLFTPGMIALLLIEDDRYEITTECMCMHEEVLETMEVIPTSRRSFEDVIINGETVKFKDVLDKYRAIKGVTELEQLPLDQFTINDGRNLHVLWGDTPEQFKVGTDFIEGLTKDMTFRWASPELVTDRIKAFYEDEDCLYFTCGALRRLLLLDGRYPLTKSGSLGLFLYGEVTTIDGRSEFSNLMIAKMKFVPKA